MWPPTARWGSQVRAPPPLCLTGAGPNGSLCRPASLPTRPADWLSWGGPRGRDPSFQRGLGGAPEGGRLPSNGAVARRVPGLRGARAVSEASAHPPGAPARSGLPPSSPAGGSRRPPLGSASGKTRSPLWEPRPFFLAGGGAQRLPLTPSLCGGAGGHCVRARNGGPGRPPVLCPGPLGNSKTTSGVCGGSPAYASRKSPGVVFPKSDRRSEAVCPLSVSLRGTLRFTEKSL